MTAAEFAANFRAALALAEPPRVPSHLAVKMLGLPERPSDDSWTVEQHYEAQMLTSRLAAWGWPRSNEPPIPLPTPEEVTAIATALGCPVERLTVSREDLERSLLATRDVLESGKNGNYTLLQFAEMLPRYVTEMVRALSHLDPSDWAEESVFRAAMKREGILRRTDAPEDGSDV